MLRTVKAAVLTLCVLVGTAVAPAATAAPSPKPPLPTNCRNRVHTPPAVDSSEQPAPGSTVPPPPTVPAQPVGGDRMGNCGYVLPRGAPPLPKDLRFQSWVLFEPDTGDVLAARDPHARLRPASLAKLLLALTVVRNLPKNEVVTGTHADANMAGTRVGMGPGGKYTVDALMHGLLMASGNDTAHALAGQLGGKEAALRKENTLAHSLGALDTRIEAPSGLDAPGMCTSAYDLSVIFRQVLRNPYLAGILRTETFPFPGFGGKPAFVVANDNRLLRTYPGDVGGKTGYTDDATHTYANSAQRDGHQVALIMMHNDNMLAGMYRNGRALMDYGFALEAANTRPVGRIVQQAPDRTTDALAVPTHTAEAPAATTGAAAGSTGSGAGLAWGLSLAGLLAVAGALTWTWRRRAGAGGR